MMLGAEAPTARAASVYSRVRNVRNSPRISRATPIQPMTPITNEIDQTEREVKVESIAIRKSKGGNASNTSLNRMIPYRPSGRYTPPPRPRPSPR